MLRNTIEAYSEIRIKAVEAYLLSGRIKEVASSFNIHPWTLKRWINWYKEGGEANLKREKKYRKPYNRFDVHIEKKVSLLKRQNPNITLSDAQKILDREGIHVSIKGIWGVWKRYGLAGFVKKNSSPSFLNYITETPETASGIKEAEKAVKKGDIQQAAHILNSLPSCLAVPFLEKIPDKLLSLQRRVEKLYTLFGKIPFSECKMKARKLRKIAEDKRSFYLSIRVGILEALALGWLQESEEMILLIHQLQYLLEKGGKTAQGDPNLRFVLLSLEGQAYGNLLQTKKSLNCARKCRIILRSLPPISESRSWLPSLFASIGHYREAFKVLKQMILYPEPGILMHYAFSLANAGEYRSALSVIKKVEKQVDEYLHSHIVLTRAMCYLGQGKIQKALNFAQLTLSKSKTEGFRNQYHTATLLVASGYAAFNEKEKAEALLQRPIPVLKKFRMERDLLVRQALLGRTSHLDCDKQENITPPIKLVLLLRKAQETLKIKDYRRAYNYAKAQKIMRYFHLYILFLPEPIHHILSKGKPSHLPSRLLKLPVFQKDIPTYHLKFLGSVHIYRNGKLIRVHLSPKEAAFLIHLCLRQGKEIALASLYRNFWQESKNPERTFSHFLVNIRKYLKLSLRSLYISKESFVKEKSLHFSSHITTDYQYYEETLAQAKALLRAGEWGFAKREFLHAFKLFRGEPFKKMYDDWSDDKRLEILFSYETEVLAFAKELRKRGRDEEAEKLLKRAEKIIPDLDEMETVLKEINGH